MKVYYNPALKELARELRKNSTPGEIKLWKQVRNKQFYGYDFHRQKPVLNYIVDFYCFRLRLTVELDGYSHNFKQDEDNKRDEELNKLGFTVLRFTEADARQNMMGIIRALEDYKDKFEQHTPSPS